MPNWCTNQIEINGTRDDIEKLLSDAKAEKNPFSLEKLVPMPKEKEKNWYEWNIANWGTKWDLSDVDIDDQGDCVFVNCQTAWGPPLEGLLNISKKYPNLELSIFYEESGMDFCGKSTFKNGEADGEERTWTEQFGFNLILKNEESFVVNEVIFVPFSTTYRSDPYEFESEVIHLSGMMKIPLYADIMDVDLEEELSENITFDCNDPQAMENFINEKSYDLSNTIFDHYEELKKTAQYNTLNKELPINPNNGKAKKI